jgi:uncharacterized membrane protein
MIKDEGLGGFTSKWHMAGNIMSTLHPKWNRVGIGFVIVGLVFQLVGSLYR